MRELIVREHLRAVCTVQLPVEIILYSYALSFTIYRGVYEISEMWNELTACPNIWHLGTHAPRPCSHKLILFFSLFFHFLSFLPSAPLP